MSFSAQIAKFGTKTSGEIQKVRQAVTIKLFNSVIMDTPVDTGRARANWQVSVGEPAQGDISGTEPNKVGLDAAQLSTVNGSTGDQPVFLTNNLPYASMLEFGGYTGGNDIPVGEDGATKSNSKGYSKQAPAGMVRRNVARFNNIVHTVLSSVRK
jgi:hypothetical protein